MDGDPIAAAWMDDADVRAIVAAVPIRPSHLVSTLEASRKLQAIAGLLDIHIDVMPNGDLTFGADGLGPDDSPLFVAMMAIVDRRFPRSTR